MPLIAPSILSADFSRLGDEIKSVENGGADYIHLDVMDGIYVPNITFGAPVVSKLRKITKLPFDVHLMVDRPERFIDDFVNAGSDIITVHAEATIHLHRTLQQIRNAGLKAGVSLNPATPLQILDYILEDIDLILLMSVNPGFGGQSYINAVTDKIRKVRKIIDDSGREIVLEVDGGIKLDNARLVMQAGADLLVVGSDIFSHGDPEQMTKLFKELF
ncbi:ribulose-phosphate 3-epimerase [Gudongella oleilytica]|jgi:ribulose-phosphate 3-epimerase|uniref:ribulose-phosphate 3-epimerase n=1 Tax=Gudongella oleilytica TaxID=1582259 RepID=UPI000EC85831|nr:ribulose-phosphate 3-epimerase [Gudongella oleilytica]MDY0256964.1 ribulose-phosphate 3-epimerase [Gudongella oleilytica]HCO19104.1 ribulose-phosphate 3-epimerase [Tissierellales bacterium]HMM69796.1 ribulose-phosphate 3-epimerase [Gudongella oleilytica]